MTNLLSKSEDTEEPKNYRQATCLSSLYKLFTGIIARMMSSHLEEHSLLPAKQKGCYSGNRDCRDQLLRTVGREERI
jgi:hypothetical protein